ncbi:MAG: hypothetical protein C5B59_19775 [Bacteroidetes bacterium]|nr:MAG: hypothetical protein C5B59_19775 [Bacteroidota bacterium]
MKLVSYLHYFFYIAWNWNPILASFIIYYEIKGERKYHINTIGENELKSLKARGIDISHFHIYMPVNYYVLEHLMQEIVRFNGNKTFLDIGCGKGRVLIVAATYGFEHITGVDISEEFCDEAEAITQRYSSKNPQADFTIVNVDACKYDIPNEVTTIFLFNPFDEIIMNEVVNNIIKSQHRCSRDIRVIYAYPEHKSIFLEHGFVETFCLKKWNHFEGVILHLVGKLTPQTQNMASS